MPDLILPSAVSSPADDARICLESAAETEDGLAAATMELRLEEVAYRAAVAAMGKALQPSLADFLR